MSLETNATWQYSVNSGTSWTSGSGSSFTLSQGTYASGAVKGRQTDQAGNTSTAASHGSVTVNNTSSSTSTSLLGGNIQGRALNLTNEVSTIATGTAGHGLTTDGTYLYACASPVKKILISNPSQVSTLSGASCTYDLTTDGTYLYVLEGPWGPVTKMSVNGGSKTTVYSGSFSDSNGVTTDGSYLYIFDGGHVKKINLSTNQLVTNLQHSGSRGIRGTMVGETLYISGTNT